MGDLSAEPSMEDILASIKRVIKEGDAPATARRPAPRPLGGHDRDAVLELNEPLAAPEPYAPVESAGFDDDYAIATPPPPPPPVPPVTPAPTPTPTPAVSAPVVEEHDEAPAASAATVEAARGALGALSRLVVKPDPDSDGTLEGLVREMLRPMLGEWLDQNLPRLVEQMVAREIAKITAGQA